MRRLVIGVISFAVWLATFTVSPVFAATANYTLTPAVASTTYNSVAKYDPVTAHLMLFSASSLIPQTDPGLSWLPASPDFDIDLSTARPTPGVYTATWGDSPLNVANVVIGSNPKVQGSRVLVLVPDYTWAAYNEIGGGSFYASNPYPAHTAESLDRPFNTNSHLAHLPANNPIKFLSDWAGGAVDVAAQSDVINLQYNLAAYHVLVLYGHDEYWTPELRSAIDGAVSNGSNLLNLSGNTGYRDVSVSNRAISVTESGSQNNTLTRLGLRTLALTRVIYLGKPTFDFLVGRSENSMGKILKLAYQNGFPRSKALSLHPKNSVQKFSRILVLVKNDPLFAGVPKDRYGFVSGGTASLMQGEIDGIPMTPKWKIAHSSWFRFTKSENVVVLAGTWRGANVKPVGVIVRSTLGRGRIITIGSISWTSAMVSGDTAAIRITKNALNLLSR